MFSVHQKVASKTVVFFLKISKEIGKVREAREPHTPVGRVKREKRKRIFSVSPQSRSLFSPSTFCMTARAYLNTQKYLSIFFLPSCCVHSQSLSNRTAESRGRQNVQYRLCVTNVRRLWPYLLLVFT